MRRRITITHQWEETDSDGVIIDHEQTIEVTAEFLRQATPGTWEAVADKLKIPKDDPQ